MKEFLNLKFRRQFLFSIKETNKLNGWQHEVIGNHNLYVHPDCALDIISGNKINIALIGYILLPNLPEKTTSEILNDILNCQTIEKITNYLYNVSGRFVLIVEKDKKYFFLNDACGLRSIYYTKDNNDTYAASQPLLLKLILNLKEGERYHKYFNSEYYKLTKENCIPSGVSLYEDVFHLVPNHYLDISKNKQIRYWPNKKLKKISLDESVDKLSSLLKNSMIAANNKFDLAVSLTAGWDSRMIFSSAKGISKDILVYTLCYRKMTGRSKDIRIPKKLLAKLGIKHKKIECRKVLNKKFIDIYKNNSDLSHVYDWGEIANGMYLGYPQDRVAVKGSCAEIGRMGYINHGDIKNGEALNDEVLTNFHFSNCDDLSFIKEQIGKWFDAINDKDLIFGYDILDLFYWEQRMGNWQSQGQLEWDIVQEVFTPFNNREIIDLMLATKPEYRKEPDYILFKEVMQNLWPEVLSVAINPRSTSFKIKYYSKEVLLSMNVFHFFDKFYNKIK